MSVPNFFIAGMPKCGTTALYEYLSKHPNVFMSTPKEPHFFSDDLALFRAVKDEKTYRSLFDKASRAHSRIGEASVHYMYSDCAIPNIARFQPDAQIVVMLRNPIDMVYSFHSQSYYNFFDDIADFEAAWLLQDRRLRGQAIPRNCNAPKLLQYRDIGKIGSHAEKLLSYFPAKQTKFILYDDFQADPAAVYHSTLEFLGLPDDNRQEFPIVNSNKGYRSSLIQRFVEHPPELARQAGKLAFGKYAGQLRLGLKGINRVETRRPPLSPTFRSELVNYFRDEVLLLSKMMERDLSSWITINDTTNQ